MGNKRKRAPERKSAAELNKETSKLPISRVSRELMQEVASNPTVILVGETGSGKTTQVPRQLLDAGYARNGRMIGVTQPRRVAAMTVAQRVAAEEGCELGDRVGYAIRFDDSTSKQTRLKYMTDGILLREAMSDPWLQRYGVIIVDEAHERTLLADVLLALLKGVQQKRAGTEHPLKLVVMSATLQTDAFCEYFPGSKLLFVQGRRHPVELLYTNEPQPDYLDAAVVTATQIHLESPPGDILVFLTGQEEIEAAQHMLEERNALLPVEAGALVVCPIYAALPPEQQMKVFEPTPEGARKVVLATNIAETSVTIPGVVYVVDTGVVKERTFHSKLGLDSLVVQPISQAAANQRAGRAGRERAGECRRLYPEASFASLAEQQLPEIKRTNLNGVVLQLKALGVKDLLRFDFIERPPTASIKRALEHVFALGALDPKGELTAMGRTMCQLPLEPMYAKALIVAGEMGCTAELIGVVSALSVNSLFFSPAKERQRADAARMKFGSPDGDHLTMLAVIKGFEEANGSMEWCREHFINKRALRKIKDMTKQLRDLCHKFKIRVVSCGAELEPVLKCIAASFFIHTAERQPDGSYVTLVGKQQCHIHPSSVMFKKKPELVVYDQLMLTQKRYMHNISAVQPAWLAEMAPRFFGSNK